jgi:phosphoglucosamine mutase
MIENAIVSGLTAVGYNVIQIGPMPTPAIAFLTTNMRCDAGIMISASHNSYEDNGIKFFDSNGDKLNERAEEEIERIYFDESEIERNQKSYDEIGSSKRIDDVIGRYIVHIKHSFPQELTLNGIRVVLDVANGAAYKVAPTIFEELGAEVILLNSKPDGKNINLSCGALHPQRLSEQVLKLRADIGFAFDGDADRLVVVDEKGRVIDGDKVLGALAVYLKESRRLKNSAMVATVMSNQALKEYLSKHKIELYRCNVGDKYVLEEMKKRDLNLGGEQSGHIILSDFAKTGDGLVASLQIMAKILKDGRRASEVLDIFDLYPQILTNVKIDKKVPFEDIEGYEKIVKSLEKIGINSLIRYSGTENLLRVLLEGEDVVLLEQKSHELSEFFKKRLND